MKLNVLAVLLITFFSCNQQSKPSPIVGTWKLVYAETNENDSIKLKDLSNTQFIKIINDTHFAFFNQQDSGNENYYGGAGTYTLTNSDYEEILSFTSVEAIKNHKFSFKIKIKGDSLIQSGVEQIKEAGIDRTITEKYIRIE